MSDRSEDPLLANPFDTPQTPDPVVQRFTDRFRDPAPVAPVTAPTPTDIWTPEKSPKSWIVAALLGVFLGIFGVHNFYLGYRNHGAAQLILGLLSFVLGGTGIGALGVLVLFCWVVADIFRIIFCAGKFGLDGHDRPLR